MPTQQYQIGLIDSCNKTIVANTNHAQVVFVCHEQGMGIMHAVAAIHLHVFMFSIHFQHFDYLYASAII